jgi:hypothetical protein
MSLPEPFGRVWRVIDVEAKMCFVRDMDVAMSTGRNASADESAAAGIPTVSVANDGRGALSEGEFERIEKHFRKSVESVAKGYLVTTYAAGRASHNEALFKALCVDPQRDVSKDGSAAPHVQKDAKAFLGIVDSLRSTHGLTVEDVLLLFAAVASVGIPQWRRPAREAVESLLRTYRRSSLSLAPAPTAIAALGSSIASASALSGAVERQPQAGPQETASAKEASRRPIEPVPAPEPTKVVEEPVDEKQSAPEGRPPGMKLVQQTALDRWLIDLVVSEVGKQVEDLDQAHKALMPILREVRALDPKRIQTNFLFGFLDALCDAEVAGSMPGDNELRRSWYLTGFAMGLMRTKSGAELAAWIRARSREDRAALTDTDPRAGALLLVETLVLQKLPAAGEHVLAAQLLAAHAERSPSFVNAQLALAQLCLLGRDRKALKGVLEQVDDGILRQWDEQEPGAVANREFLLGELRRLEGRFAEAEGHYRAAVRSGVDLVTGNAEIGMILCHANVPDLEDIVLTSRTLQNLKSGLATGHDALARHLDQGPTAPAMLLAALHDLLLQRNHFYGPAEIGNRMREVVELIRSPGAPVRMREEFAHRVEAWAALADLIAANAPFAAEATRTLARWLESLSVEERPPADHVFDALAGSIACGVEEASELAEVLLKFFGSTSLKKIPINDICQNSPRIATRIVEQLRTEGKGIGAVERFGFARQLIEALLRVPGEESAEATAEAFDLMQEIAGAYPKVREEFEAFCVREDDALAACLDPDSRLEAFLSVAQIANDPGWCGRAALRLLPRARVREDDAYLEELVELMRGAGLENEIPQHHLHWLHERRKSVANVKPNSCAGITIFYVGGNEIQAQYEAAVKASLRARFSSLGLSFHFPGWTSNWHVELEAVRKKLESMRPKVVVMSTLVRTQFGRNLRRMLGEMDIQWRSCTGRGRDSIDRAMTHAVGVATGTAR